MKTRLAIIATCLISMMAVFADSSNPFTDLFRAHFPSANSNQNEKNIKSFIGDSIYFEIEGNDNLSNVTIEVPDTIWLKEKRSRKPKEGKDFILCYNYKGIQDGNSFVTSSSEINGKTFGLLSVTEIKDISSYTSYPKTIGYDLVLVEPYTANVLHVALTTDIKSEWRMYSKNTNNRIKNLIAKTFYQKEKYGSKIYTHTLTSGELYLKVSTRYGVFYAEPHAEFIFTSSEGSPMSLRYNANELSYDLRNTAFITQAEYEKELEKQRIYKINYDLPTDSAALAARKCLSFNIIPGIVDSFSAYVSQNITPGYYPLGIKTLPFGTIIFIAGKIKVRDVDYYEAAVHGKPFYIECSKVKEVDTEKLDTLLSQPKEVIDAFAGFAKEFSRYDYLEDRLKQLKEVEKLNKRGLIVVQANPYDESEYTDGTGMNFEVINTSNKTIKYITFNFVGYNAVHDPVPSMGLTVLTRKGIGPIEPYESGAYQYEYVWFTDIVESAKLRSIVVQYMNGTSKTFTGEALQIVDKEVIEAPFIKSPVIDFLPIYDDDKE